MHPRLSDSDDRSDFLARSERRAFYVEAATTFSGIEDDQEHSALEARILDAVEKVQSATFTSRSVEGIGTDMPRIREIVRPIQEWLDKLDRTSFGLGHVSQPLDRNSRLGA